MRATKPRSWFTQLTKTTAHAMGRPAAFTLAVSAIVVWAITGPLYGYSDTWQLAINTGTTVVTFLMVFLIQSTQNRDAEAMHVKLDEIIRAIGSAKNEVLDLEELEEEDLAHIRASYEALARKARAQDRVPHGHLLPGLNEGRVVERYPPVADELRDVHAVLRTANTVQPHSLLQRREGILSFQ